MESGGCIICAAASQQDACKNKWRYLAFAQYQVARLKLGNVKRHEKCRAHRGAIRAAGLTPPADSHEPDGNDAPSIEDIMTFWANRKNGASLVAPSAMSGDTSNGFKHRQIEWCIAETRRYILRMFIEKWAAGSVTLLQDGRGKHVLVRASACDDALEHVSGTLSVVASQGGATNLCVATLQAIQEFCTPGFGRPGKPHPDVPPPQVDKPLLEKLCGAVAWWFTDAAYDEFAAGELLFSLPEAKAMFPNLRVVGREKAHASRRVLSRPQNTDPYLKEVSNRFVWDYDSVASMIQHNATINDVFSGAARSDPAASQLTQLRFRRHRFDSQAEPMTRIVVAFDAILQTMVAVSHARKTEDVGKSAASFLQWVTDEACLQLAMIADASDQVLVLVRSNDTDHPDPAQMASFVQSFLLEGARLWLEGHCWEFGCTASMLRFLKLPRTYLIAGGQKGVCQLGGHHAIDEACRKRCLERMVCWFRLAIDVCHAEWPYYDIVNALQVLTLGNQPSSGMSESLQSQSLERLANVFGCRPDVLESQYIRHLPIAKSAHSISPGTTLQAWRQALVKTTRALKKGSKGDWNNDVLRTILMHYGACCASTSALERIFSKMEKVWGARVNNANTSHIRDLLELMEPLTEDEMRKTTEIAQYIWRLYYPCGYRKKSAAPRIDKGISREKKSTGLAAFNRSRHSAKLKNRAGCSLQEIERLADERVMSAGGWTPSMQKEHEFQMHKVVRGAAEAYQSNAVLQSEKALFHDIAMEHQAKRAKTIRARFRADSRKTERLSPTQPLDFSLGGCVFVEPDCLDGFGAGAPVVGCQLADVSESGFRRIVRQNGMQRVDDPIDAAAGYIVVASLKDPGRANYWVAVLSGGALVTPDYFASGGKSGSCLCWHAAVQIKRGVWMSPEWQRDEPLLASLLQWATRLPASKWRLRGELDSRAYVARQKKQKTFIGIISARQKALPTFQVLPHAFAQDQFLEFVAKADEPRSGYVNAGSVPSSSGAASSSTT